jgi:hypothetical protein
MVDIVAGKWLYTNRCKSGLPVSISANTVLARIDGHEPGHGGRAIRQTGLQPGRAYLFATAW